MPFSYPPVFTPGKAGLDFGFIRGGQDADVPIEMLRIVTGNDTGVFGIDAWYLGIYVYDPPNNRLAKIWDSGDVKGVLSSQRQRYNFATGLTSKAKNDQLLAVATLQIAPGFFQTPRGIGCIFQTGISEPAGVVPQARAAYLNIPIGNLPQYVSLNDLVWDKQKVLWASLGPIIGTGVTT
ncbi:hypothetical protein SEA_ORLA_28 [Gordonia phage Orla]|nr:hypothetical protein SEA_ORLA_28 [Gordonia phage Orla]WNN96119.1 hypothetical protein SEA_NODIGI_28 [Gordonia phage Nodigi]